MTQEKSARVLTILGLEVGTYEDWEEIENCVLQFYNVTLNEKGFKWLGETGTFSYLTLDFNNGVIQVTHEIDDEAIEIERPNWSIFNKN